MCVNLVVMLFVVDEKLVTRRGWHRAKRVGLLFLIAAHFHSTESALGLFTSSKSEYSTASARSSSKRHLTALRSQGHNDSTGNRPRGTSIDGIQRI